MKLSTERILTTHTGSLPRPRDLTAMLEALDGGDPPEAAGFAATVRRAVGDVVRKQAEVGVDVVNDGEQGKVGYSTYVRHRLTGFGGANAVPTRADWADFPEAAARQRRSVVARPACIGHVRHGSTCPSPSAVHSSATRSPGAAPAAIIARIITTPTPMPTTPAAQSRAGGA